jgi:hypothetical protein
VLDRHCHCRQPQRLTFSRISLNPNVDLLSRFRLARQCRETAIRPRQIGAEAEAANVVRIGEVLSVGRDMPNALGSVGVSPYIEGVFENDLVGLDAAQTLAAAEANEHALITAETRRLHIAAHWADLHPDDAVVESRLPGTEHPVQLGGDGTPTVGDFAPADSGVCYGSPSGRRAG